MAGSVTPQKAEIAAGKANPLRLCWRVLRKTARAPAPCANIVKETIILMFDSPVVTICCVKIGITNQWRPKITRTW